MSFRHFILPAMTAAAIALAMPAFAADAPLTRDDVRKIVQEYIMENPNVIMESVDQYQQKTVRERSAQAIKTNADSLFKNENAPFLGAKDGDVVVVEFFDYNCGYCKRVLPEVQKVVKEDPKVKVIFYDYPILSETSRTAAKWALAAHMQNQYFPFHTRLMEHKGAIDDATLESIAKDLDLDVGKIKKDIESTEVAIALEKNMQLASQLGVRGTPAFVIGHDMYPGALPAEEMKKLITEARAAKKK